MQRGAEDAVSFLLSAGASNRAVIESCMGGGVFHYFCPLADAVSGGHDNVVRILLDDGLEAVGGLFVIPNALHHALKIGRPRTLLRLLAVQGNTRKRFWARCSLNGVPMLHYAVAFGDSVGVSVLLAAGADETVPGCGGRMVKGLVGTRVPAGEESAAKEAVVHRTLEQSPAFRARSWTWPRIGAGTTAAADAAPMSSRAPRAPLGVLVSRPRNRMSFAKLVGR